MRVTPVPKSAVWGVNGQLLLASAGAVMGYLCWPSTMFYWQMAIFSFFGWLLCLSQLIKAVRMMRLIKTRAETLGALFVTHRDPEPAKLADQKTLEDAGMM